MRFRLSFDRARRSGLATGRRAFVWIVVVTLYGLLTTAGWCQQRSHVLLIVSDDQRADTLGASGNAHIRTPVLDRLARRGIRFTRAVSPNPICTPARAELMTGNSGFRNGVLDFGGTLDRTQPRWAETMQAAGYETCYVGKWHNDGRPADHGYGRTCGLFAGGGGRWWKDQLDVHGEPVTGYRGWVFQSADGSRKFPERGVGLTADISEVFAEATIEFLRDRDPERPFFLHVNFTAPHDPLLLPSDKSFHHHAEQMRVLPNVRGFHPFDHGNLRGRDERLLPWPRTRERVRADLAAYYSVISHLDAQVGRILNELQEQQELANTIVIFVSDHGLAMGSHGLRGKQNMYEHTVNVPLLIAGPKVARDRICDAQIYLRDLYSTVCGFLGLPRPAELDGRDWSRLWVDPSQSGHELVTAYFRDKQRMIRGDRWKYILYPDASREQLFDLKNDPCELVDLSDQPAQADRLQQLRRQLHQWRTRVNDPSLKPVH